MEKELRATVGGVTHETRGLVPRRPRVGVSIMSAKKVAPVLWFVLLAGPLPLQAVDPVDRLAGQWVGTYQGNKPLSITFGPDNHVTLVAGGQVEKGTYKVDFTRNPPHLDLDWRQGRAGGRLRTIVEVLNGRLWLEDNAPGNPRPAKFSKDALVLRRK